ncbi:GNAT family N-acetyltransferase [Cyanobacteria bacterium FACHB-63]|nr:GNAT family N-acetyltransferase [Cyanobacteria bacterium FACHB-63]
MTLAQQLATSFVIDPQAFEIALPEILANASSYLAVAIRNSSEQRAAADCDNWAGEVESKAASEIVGYVLGFNHFTFYAKGRVAWVAEIVVHEAFRKRGIGTLLMQSFEAWAARQNAKLVALSSRRAVPFYQALGYEESARYLRKFL